MKFFGGQLVPHASVRHAGLEVYDLRIAPDLPVEFIDTADCDYQEVTIPESRSTANPKEAHLQLERLAQLPPPKTQLNTTNTNTFTVFIKPIRCSVIGGNRIMAPEEDQDSWTKCALSSS